VADRLRFRSRGPDSGASTVEALPPSKRLLSMAGPRA